MSKAVTFTEKEGLSEVLQQSISEAKDLRFNTNDSESSTYASSIASNLSEAESQMQSASTSFAKEDSYREAAQMMTQQGTGFNQDMSQKYVEWLSEQNSGGKQLGASGVHHVISDEDINRRYMQSFIQSEGAQLQEQFKNQSPISSVSMKEQYRQQAEEVGSFNNPAHHFEQTTKTVVQEAEKQELTKKVVSNLPQAVNQKLEKTDQNLNFNKSNLQAEQNQAADKFPGQKE